MSAKMDWNNIVKSAVGAVCLAVVTVAAFQYGETELAGVGVGALAAWILKNGVTSGTASTEKSG